MWRKVLGIGILVLMLLFALRVIPVNSVAWIDLILGFILVVIVLWKKENKKTK